MKHVLSHLAHAYARAAAKNRRLLATALLLAAAPLPCAARTDCQISSVGDVGFGAYDVFSKVPNRAGVGTLRIKCQGGGQGATVKLSKGQSHSYTTRLMRSGNDLLEYNLYTSAARIVVWGDGSGVSEVMRVDKNQNIDLSIFGNIPQGQDPAVGSYADSILISVEF
jgi:spore coat protein U-like protein